MQGPWDPAEEAPGSCVSRGGDLQAQRPASKDPPASEFSDRACTGSPDSWFPAPYIQLPLGLVLFSSNYNMLRTHLQTECRGSNAMFPLCLDTKHPGFPICLEILQCSPFSLGSNPNSLPPGPPSSSSCPVFTLCPSSYPTFLPIVFSPH